MLFNNCLTKKKYPDAKKAHLLLSKNHLGPSQLSVTFTSSTSLKAIQTNNLSISRKLSDI